MIFTSVIFFVFFAVVLSLLALVRNPAGRVGILLVASYFFYGNWNAHHVILIFLYGLWGWGFGLLLHNARTVQMKKFWLTSAIVLCLATLAYFKYANFFAENLVGVFGLSEWRAVDVALPVGISFYTFHTMSYLIDLYRGEVAPSRNPFKFLLFVSFFPQLVAGPILRASSFLPQLDKPVRLTWPNFVSGAQLFLGGAIQKSLFADQLSIFVDQVYRQPQLYSAGTLWLGVAAYSMQIFCDFAGYSLMAIGTARILGFELPENFRMPYVSRSIAEFWRRWHISLSTWLRDYLYIPLGGNRGGMVRTQANMLITMLLGGLWHGASWNFVIWGGMHGVALGIHRGWGAWRKRCGWTEEQESPLYKTSAWALTLLFCCLAWIPFRSHSFETTAAYFRGLLPGAGRFTWYHSPTIVILVAAVLWHLAYVFAPKLIARYPFPAGTLTRWPAVLAVGYGILLVVLFAPLNTQPFIYFQF